MSCTITMTGEEYDAIIARAEAAEAREQALREALERARETKDTFFRNAEAWETKCNAAWVERDAAEAREQALREALKRASANVPDWEKLAWKS
jgi:flavin-binding protein dodecin